MSLPREYGGGDRAAVERFVVAEELLRWGAPVGHHWVADRQSGPLLAKVGTREQKERFLPAICRGELSFCIGMSEPDSGSDLASVVTRGDSRRGRVDRERHEGLDHRCPRARLDDRVGAHERGRGPPRGPEPGADRPPRAGRRGQPHPLPRRHRRLQRGRVHRRVRARDGSGWHRGHGVDADRPGARVRTRRPRSVAFDLPRARAVPARTRRHRARRRVRRIGRIGGRPVLGLAQPVVVGRPRDRRARATVGAGRAGQGDGDALRARPPREHPPLRRLRTGAGLVVVVRAAPRQRHPHLARVHHPRRHDRDPAVGRGERPARERAA